MGTIAKAWTISIRYTCSLHCAGYRMEKHVQENDSLLLKVYIGDGAYFAY